MKIDLDELMTVERFAKWRQVATSTVRARLASTPGVIMESRSDVRIHPRSYLDGMKQRRCKVKSAGRPFRAKVLADGHK